MDKVIDRLIELLPIPVFIALILVIGAGWLIKEIRELPSAGALLRDPWFMIVCVATAANTLTYYASATILANSKVARFPESQRGVLVARFEADTDNKVQLQTSESLKDNVAKSPSLSDVRVSRLENLLKEGLETKTLKDTGARLVVWGTFVPPDQVHAIVATSDVTVRIPLEKFPDVTPLTSQIVQFLQGTPPPPGASTDARITFLNNRIALLENELRSPSRIFPVAPSLTSTIPQLKVLTVGIDRYQASEIMALRYAASDALAVGRALESHAPRSSVFTLIDADATRDKISRTLTKLGSESGPDSTILVYWAGHGIDRGVNTYLVPFDGAAVAGKAAQSNLIAVSDLLHWSATTAAPRFVLLLDSVGFSGSPSALTDDKNALTLPKNQKISPSGLRLTAVLSAAAQGQAAVESTRLNHSLFAYALIEGLSGKADYAGKGVITFQELFDYVTSEVTRMSTTIGFKQRTSLSISGNPEALALPLIESERDSRESVERKTLQ
jgi:hypothetical protein